MCPTWQVWRRSQPCSCAKYASPREDAGDSSRHSRYPTRHGTSWLRESILSHISALTCKSDDRLCCTAVNFLSNLTCLGIKADPGADHECQQEEKFVLSWLECRTNLPRRIYARTRNSVPLVCLASTYLVETPQKQLYRRPTISPGSSWSTVRNIRKMLCHFLALFFVRYAVDQDAVIPTISQSFDELVVHRFIAFLGTIERGEMLGSSCSFDIEVLCAVL